MTEVATHRGKDRKDYFAVYREQNAAEIRRYNNDYYLNNREAIRERQKAYYRKKRDEKMMKDLQKARVMVKG
jgi:hypothetical protein